MGDGAGHRVRRVVGLGNLPDAQQHPHHHLHLMLIRAAVTDDGLLDLHRRVFKQVIRVFLTGDQRHAARAADLYARRHVFGEKKLLERDFVGLEGFQQAAHARVDAAQARGEGVARIGNQRAVLHQLLPIAVRLNHAPAHRRQTGVDAQYSQEKVSAFCFI